MKHLYRAVTSGIICLTLIAIFIWSCLEYGQFDHSMPERCRSRKSIPEDDPRRPADPEHGFYGDKDLYGMGTRLGIYAQWAASLIATMFLDFEQTRLAAAFICFEAATLVSFFFIIFNHACVFSVECLVVVYFLLGGIAAVLGPDLVAGLLGRRHAKKLAAQDFITMLLICAISAVTAWFWIRLALVGNGADFAATPGGTSLFIMAHARDDQIRQASIYMAIVCTGLAVWTFEKTFGLTLVKILELPREPPALLPASFVILIAAFMRWLGISDASPIWPKVVVDWACECLPWRKSWSRPSWLQQLREGIEGLCPKWKDGPNRCDVSTRENRTVEEMKEEQKNYHEYGVRVKV
jgi:hypothetical protein